MTAVEELAITLDDVKTDVDVTARDLGHVPVWGDVLGPIESVSYGRCSRCGATAAIRVHSDGRKWRAGKLRIKRCPDAL